MTRVIVHAGFHKTGTTSLQRYLARHRDAFAPHFTYYGHNDIKLAGIRAQVYAQRRFPWRMRAFRLALRDFLATVPDFDTLVLSRETFSGTMPGHRDWLRRPIMDFRRSAVPLLKVVGQELRRHFGREVEPELLFTTRDPEPWLRSVYGHLLRSIHLTETWEDYRAHFPDLLDLEAEAGRIARAVRISHSTRAMEDLVATRPGPALAVLDLAGVPEATWAALPPAERANPGQSKTLDVEFLRLNRSGQSKATLKRIKDRMRAEERTGTG